MQDLTATGGVSGPGRIGRVAIGDLLKRAAARFPDRVALTDGVRRVTFTEIERDANRFANYLVGRGLKPGEKISTVCNNSVEFVKALFGIHRAGLVWVPINTLLGPADMDYILDHAQVRFALIDDNLYAQPDRRAALLMRGFDPLVCMEAIVRDRLTVFVGLSLMYQAILDHPRRKDYDLSGLKTCIYTMAPMGRPLLERAMADMCPNFVLTSGQTEMYPATTMSQPDRQLKRFGNYWGESLIVNETAIMDDDGNLLPRGQAGELVHRGPNVMMGYYKDPKATEEARKFGWHHTGDLALIDEHGEVLFLDRKKDMIKSGGENVASVKIEEALLAHPAVQNAAVVGLPHPQWGEAVSAFVKLKPGAQADEAGISEHCRKHLGGFQVPKLVRILDEMPMTATGKLRKVELRQAFAEHFAKKSV